MNDYLLVGTEAVGGIGGTTGGQIFVTFTGGGTPGVGNQWTNLSAGLDGSIHPGHRHQPHRRQLRGLRRHRTRRLPHRQHLPGRRDLAEHHRQPLLDHATTVRRPQPRTEPGSASSARSRSTGATSSPTTSPTPTGPTHPVLYVAGDGGVFRSIDNGVTWSLFPDETLNDAPLGDGGGLPNAHITDLDLSLGLVNPTTGRPDVSTGPNILLATTYGRGQFAIRLAPLVFPNPANNTPRILGIDQASDSGLSNTDHVTNIRTPNVVGLSEQTAFGNVVYITLFDLTDPANPRYIGGFQGDPNSSANLANTAIQTDSAGRFGVRVNPGALTVDGVKTIGVQATNLSGTKGNMATFEFTLDTTAPTAPQLPILTLASDTGLSTSDQITRLNSDLQFQINFAAIDAGARVTLYRGANPVGTPLQGNGSVVLADPGPLGDGLYTYKAALRDLAGNDSPFSPILNVRVDATKPVTPGATDLLAADDSGVSDSDNITNVRQPRFSGIAERNTFPDPNDPAGPAAVKRPNRVELVDSANNVVGTADIDSATGQYVVQPANPLSNGSFTFVVRVIDRAGNPSDPSSPLTVQILQVTPQAPTLRLLPQDDSGLIGDNITNVTTPRLEGQGVPGLFVQLIDIDGTITGTVGGIITPTGGQPPIFVQSDRSYSLQFPNPLADGIYNVRTRTFDVAGNESFSPVLELTIQTDGPAPAAHPDPPARRRHRLGRPRRHGHLCDQRPQAPLPGHRPGALDRRTDRPERQRPRQQADRRRRQDPAPARPGPRQRLASPSAPSSATPPATPARPARP